MVEVSRADRFDRPATSVGQALDGWQEVNGATHVYGWENTVAAGGSFRGRAGQKELGFLRENWAGRRGWPGVALLRRCEEIE